ncbi:hypothetical protein M408DRAFT_332125 [Serendipita vermifera MAFF 305830]|uniref:Uncharacterized protein n=1 Tax=Serendipita vermifera MAFF 305830 TaxID=933852 RepID=A0A0C3AX74_SERVB|nr:hypothetical protein M408DRAFT_332125 [Serendipita vermifera MAFF 305830]
MPANANSRKKSPSLLPQSTPKPIESSEYTEKDLQMALHRPSAIVQGEYSLEKLRTNPSSF